ncbi:ATP-binding protein [Rheinheimera marina]|uniref:histidine kinase n=1 Tax=Rheinheimera marina TaxID=1774958 RepID=A0ABV9JKY5_9GAMM
MSSALKATSMKGALIWVVMLICSITLCVSLTIATLQDIKAEKKNLSEQLHAYAAIIAFNAVGSLEIDDPEIEDKRLASFAAEPRLTNIHIYKQQENGELTFFASYNRRDIGPYPTQFSRVEQLKNTLLSEGAMELSQAIESDGKRLGYVYVRSSLDELSDYVQNRVLFDILIALCSLIGAFILAIRLQNRFTQPIYSLLSLVQKVSKDKDYHVRVPAMEIIEFHNLGRAVNTMLDRTEQQINKLQGAESEIRQLNQDLEHKISERTLALKSSNQDLLNTLSTLHQYQNQIVETEKMASLGQMVAGVAHEVNTPIGLGVTASTLMQDKLLEIQRAFDDKKLTSSQLAKFLSDSSENLGIIYRNLERAANLIRSFKQVAVDQSNDNRRMFNMSQLLNEVLLSLRPNLKKTQHQVLIECDEQLEFESKPGPISQILINLIMNSLIHAFEQTEQGQISVSVTLANSRCFLHYKDNGCGVPENIKKRIFDPFVTTKRGEGGSGLGMHLVYNLVTQALNGKIQLDSTLGQGIDIHIDFPVIPK